MLKKWLIFFFICIGLLLSTSILGICQQKENPSNCEAFSDPFDNFNVEKWQDVLLYSKTQGIVTVEDGRLVLKAPLDKPCEIQVYSLFTFSGDFDIQADYEVVDLLKREKCRFNTGMVMQTLNDEQSYKCYIASRPGKRLFFRSRLDRFGEDNLEEHKIGPANKTGTIRVVRKKGRLAYYILENESWRKIYSFEGGCDKKMRLRFKLQNGSDEERKEACKGTVEFDNFKVNSCDTITKE
jgi:hypothetical protein